MEKADIQSFINFLNHIYSDDVTWRVLKALARSEGLTLRELARRTSVSPKTLYKYLDKLREREVVEVHKPGPRVFLIRLTAKYQWLKEVFNHTAVFVSLFFTSYYAASVLLHVL